MKGAQRETGFLLLLFWFPRCISDLSVDASHHKEQKSEQVGWSVYTGETSHTYLPSYNPLDSPASLLGGTMRTTFSILERGWL